MPRPLTERLNAMRTTTKLLDELLVMKSPDDLRINLLITAIAVLVNEVKEQLMERVEEQKAASR